MTHRHLQQPQWGKQTSRELTCQSTPFLVSHKMAKIKTMKEANSPFPFDKAIMAEGPAAALANHLAYSR